jgi:predicted GH43/DUF377 family glycosyl hydrolase
MVLVPILLCGAAMAIGQTVWDQYPGNPVLGPGDPGSWDEFARVEPTVLFDGSVYHMWFAGYDAAFSGGGFGHAISPDGVDWTDIDPNNPVLTPGDPGQWDEIVWNRPAVVFDGGLFHMWYAGEDAQGIVRGGYATSPDGSTWTKHLNNPVIDVGSPGSWDERHVRPGTVIFDDGIFKMWYSGWSYSAYVAIGYAESANGIEWTKWPAPVFNGADAPAWDVAVSNPSVVFDGSAYHMLYGAYNGNGGDWMVGYVFSSNGIAWPRHLDDPVMSVDGEDVYVLPVVFNGSTWHGWYTAFSGPGTWSIFYATSTCCAGIFGDDFETGDTLLWSVTVP